MALIKCNECGKQVSDKALSCPGCGNPLDEEKKAANTMAEVKPKPPRENKVMTPAPVVVVAPKSKGLAILLALLLGGLGAHKFYLGQPWWGVLYLVFVWTFIPSIIALIDAIIYLFTSDASFQEAYSSPPVQVSVT